MSLVTLITSPVNAGKKMLREARFLVKSVGSKDDIADDLFKYASDCINIRLAIMKFIELDNLMHRHMAKKIASGKSTPITLNDWRTAVTKSLGVLDSAIDDCIKTWKTRRLDRMKKAFGFGLEQLVDAQTTAKEFIEALKD